MADGDGVEALDAVALRKGHVNELGIHVLDVGEDEELFEAGMIAHVAVLAGIGVSPLPGGLAEEGNVEEIGLVGVGKGGLLRCDFGGDQMGLDGVGVEPVVDLGEGAVEIPREREAAVLVLLEALEFLDEVDFELGADPHSEFEGDILVGVGAAVATCRGPQADGVGLFHPLLDAQLVAVQARLTFNCGEFAGIKIGIVDRFPNPEKFDGVPVPQPVGDEEFSILRFEHVRQGNEVVFIPMQHSDFRALDLEGGRRVFTFHYQG